MTMYVAAFYAFRTSANACFQVLLARLPPLSRLQEDAAHAAVVSAEHAVIAMSMEEAFLEEIDQPDPATLSRSRSISESSVSKGTSSGSTAKTPKLSKVASGPATPRKRPYEPHDVYRAIESVHLPRTLPGPAE